MKESELNAKNILLPFLLKMVGLSLVLQLLITFRGNKIDMTSVIFLVLIAIYYYYFIFYKKKHSLKKVRFGSFISHLVGYITINLGFLTHMLFLVAVNSPALRSESGSPLAINGNWFGYGLCMPVFWGLTGLLPHLIVSILNRGFEEK